MIFRKDKHRGEKIKDDAIRRNHERGVFINSLLLQQQALKNIWDSEEEDAYEQKIEVKFGYRGLRVKIEKNESISNWLCRLYWKPLGG